MLGPSKTVVQDFSKPPATTHWSVSPCANAMAVSSIQALQFEEYHICAQECPLGTWTSLLCRSKNTRMATAQHSELSVSTCA